MRLDIVNLCARSPTMLATITQIRQAPSEQITERRVHNCGITRMKFPLWQPPEVLSRNYMYFPMYFHWLISPGTVFRNWLKIMN